MLNQAGFEVVMAFDLTRDIMKQTVEEFAARVLEKGNNTIAMVYYAGHGIQADGENYLIPIDAKFSAEDDLAEQGVKLADIVAALEATQTKARIVVVDACRNNPFGGSADDDTGGFALVDAPEGALIAYSTVARHGGVRRSRQAQPVCGGLHAHRAHPEPAGRAGVQEGAPAGQRHHRQEADCRGTARASTPNSRSSRMPKPPAAPVACR